jgi:nucleoside 2-deoxyribosyltransferase
LIVVVCGSIGYGGILKIRSIQSFLREKGFLILDHISEEHMDYSDIKDFRDKRELAEKIVKHDLEFIKKGDVIVAVSNGPSYGTAIEMYVAKQLGKHVILYSEEEVPTPWPIAFSDTTARDLDSLVSNLKEFEKT